MNLQSFLPELDTQTQAFLAGFPATLLHAGTGLLLLFLGAALYALLSPHKEISQINQGNNAAAVAFGGVVVCLAIPLAAALMASRSLIEIGLWGGATILVQLLLFRIIDMVLMGLPARVKEGEVSAALLLVAAKLSAALILAAALAG